MDFLHTNLDPSYLWGIIGFVLLLTEFTLFPGLGILFLGLGALSNAALIFNYDFSLYYQIFIFCSSSLIWFLILWWPLKYYVYKHNTKDDYQGMLGNKAEVLSSDLNSKVIGQIKWSGTILNAKLQTTNNVESALKGEIVIIKKMEGNVAWCIKMPE